MNSISAAVVGREAEHAVVQACAREARHATPRVVVLEGEAGAGKTSLLRSALAALDGFTVLRAEADELAGDVSMWLVEQVATVSTSRPFAAGQELLHALSEKQAAGPVALVIEDLHWSDPASSATFLTALRRLTDGDRILALVTTRPEGLVADPLWQKFADDAERCRRVTVGPLTVREVGALAASASVTLGPNAAARLHRHTGGHALHVRTLLMELTPAELNGVAPLPAPQSLAQSTRERVRSLPDSAVELLEALAVVGGSAGLIVLGTIASLSDPSAALARAMETGFLDYAPRDPAHRVNFVHPLYRVAIYDGLSPVRRRRLHLAAGAAMTDPATRLHHRIAAADHADPELAADLDRAAASARDPAQAATYLTAAAEIGGTDGAAPRILAAGEVCMSAGRLAAMRSLEPQLAACPASARRNVELGWLAWQTGQAARAEALLHAAVELVDEPPALRARAYMTLSVIANTQSRGADGVRYARAAIALSAHDSPEARLATFIMVGAVGQSVGGVRGLAALLEQYPDPWDDTNVDMNLAWGRGMQNHFAGQVTESLRWLERASGAVQRDELSPLLGDRRAQTNVIAAQGYFAGGEWDRALVHAHAGVDLAADESQVWITAQAHAITAMVHAARGESEQAAPHIDHGARAAEVVPTPDAVAMMCFAKAAVAHAARDAAGVIAMLEPLTRDGAAALPMASSLSFWPGLVHARLDTGDTAGAVAELGALRAAGERRALDLGMQIHTLTARIAAADGDSRLASAEFTAAVAAETPDRPLLDRAELHASFATHLRAVGRRREANERFAVARALLAGVRAAPYVAEIDRRMLGSGVERAEGNGHFSALTERERDVVTLAVGGHTNREAAAMMYVSVKAVEYHLSNAYAKLGVRTRRDLRALVGTHEFGG